MSSMNHCEQHLILPGDDMPMMDPYEMNQILGHGVDLILDGGYCGFDRPA